MAKQQLNGAQTQSNYSTSEIDTGKKWVDGRTVYRKVYTGTLNVASGSGLTAFPHGISGITPSFLIVSSGGSVTLSTTSGASTWQMLPFLNGADRFHISQLSGANIQYHATFGWGNSNYWFTMEYVK